jgi:uncharacterized surface protein with fasciclin (FAS1) repeats
MKKLILLIFILLSASSLFAQKPDSTITKPGKARNVDGAIINPSTDILGNISSAPEFSKFAGAIKATALADTFSTVQITVFAPTNKAFDKLPAGKLDTLLLPAHNIELANLLKYHAVAGRISSKDLNRQIKAGNGQAILTTLQGGTLKASINANRNIVLTDDEGNQSIISKFDIQNSNGLLYVITDVLTPKSAP